MIHSSCSTTKIVVSHEHEEGEGRTGDTQNNGAAELSCTCFYSLHTSVHKSKVEIHDVTTNYYTSTNLHRAYYLLQCGSIQYGRLSLSMAKKKGEHYKLLKQMERKST
jgi:hypothetical protein